MKALLWSLLMMTPLIALSQSSYKGRLGNQPITLIMYHHGDGVSQGLYVYHEHDEPLLLTGTLAGQDLTLEQLDNRDSAVAVFSFNKFTPDKDKITGTWKTADTLLPVSLQRDFKVLYGKTSEFEKIELLQAVHADDHYYKTIVNKKKGDHHGKVVGVKVYQKKTDSLLQTIDLECQLYSINNISVGDYNFDGLQDFSILQANLGGPNTVSLYLLRDPKTGLYEMSKYKGNSLSFNSKNKEVYEYKLGCDGQCQEYATYIVVDNKLVLTKKRCVTYDKHNNKYYDVPCKD